MIINAAPIAPPPAQPSTVGPGPDVPVQPTPDPAPPVGDAAPLDRLSAAVMGKVASAQAKAVESQQLLGAVSHLFTARISQVAKDAWALLRGT